MSLHESTQFRRAESTRQRGSGQAEQIRAGDQAAFRALFLAHYEALCRYAYRHVDSQEVAEDLVQDVFFDLWKRRATWHPTSSPRAYLYGAVRNQVLNHQRRARTRDDMIGQDALDGLLSLDDPEETLQCEELTRISGQAIDALPPRCRHIFILSREQDLTYAEIAAALDISVKTVETHMGRALKHLRDRLSSLRS